MKSAISRLLHIVAHPATVILVLLLAGLTVAWSWPRTVKISGRDVIVHYRGFLNSTIPWLGPKFYRIESEGLEITYSGPGYNAFVRRWPDGTLAARGTCLVEQANSHSVPEPKPSRIEDGEFFALDGTLASTIVDGTGTEKYWHSTGVPALEIGHANRKVVASKQWNESGRLVAEFQKHDDGLWVCRQYRMDGSKVMEWHCWDEGVLTGPRTFFHPDGAIEKIEHYDVGKLVRLEWRDKRGDDAESSASPN